jgi:streptomycin 6-kinase
MLNDSATAVLKIGMPHMEGEREIQGLRFWDGNSAVRLLDAGEENNAMLFERCEPGTSLREMPESEQDLVIARLLRKLLRVPVAPHSFRPPSEMLHYCCWRQISMPAMCCARSASHGWSSIRNRLSAIRRMTRPRT